MALGNQGRRRPMRIRNKTIMGAKEHLEEAKMNST
jgi:hypothetical protein